MTIFKTLDIRGLPFFSSYQRTLEALREVKIDGVLEIVLDPKNNLMQTFKKWASSEGYHATDMDDGSQTTRLFIKKLYKVGFFEIKFFKIFSFSTNK